MDYTVLGVLKAAEDWLGGRGVEAPRRSAELLMGSVLGLSRLQLYLAHDRPVTEEERGALRPLVARRGEGEPSAYVLGDWDFVGLTLEVGPAVMVPRPETEGLVELALERAVEGARCADLGTGSGAIAVAMAVAREDLEFWAVDCSADALEVAERNAERHRVGGRIRFFEGSLWEPLGDAMPFDMVVSNPPYVDPESELLSEEVRRYEPAEALFTTPGDPVSCYREILAELERGLCPGGWLVLETGEAAAQPALELLEGVRGLQDVELRKDLQGTPRYLLARVT